MHDTSGMEGLNLREDALDSRGTPRKYKLQHQSVSKSGPEHGPGCHRQAGGPTGYTGKAGRGLRDGNANARARGRGRHANQTGINECYNSTGAGGCGGARGTHAPNAEVHAGCPAASV